MTGCCCETLNHKIALAGSSLPSAVGNLPVLLPALHRQPSRPAVTQLIASRATERAFPIRQPIPRNSSSSRSGFVGVFGAAAFFLETSTRNFKRKLEAETCSWHARWSVKFTWPAHRETQQQTTKRLRRPEACLVCIGTSLAKGSVTLPSSEGANPKLIHENEGLEAGECGVAIAVISDAHQESRTPSSLLSLRPPVVDSIKVASGTAAHKRRDRSTADASTPWPSLPLPAGHSCWAFGWVPN